MLPLSHMRAAWEVATVSRPPGGVIGRALSWEGASTPHRLRLRVWGGVSPSSLLRARGRPLPPGSSVVVVTVLWARTSRGCLTRTASPRPDAPRKPAWR